MREWQLRALLIIGSPLMFLALAEAALRMAGFGCPASFFVPVPGGGAEAANEQFAWRFFPPGTARTPVPFVLPRLKKPGVYRVFVLGESAAMGVPEPAFGLPRALEHTLRKRYPEKQFEVVNAAMTAINSHVIVDIARECAARQPDLFVLYIGNNEVVGPYAFAEHRGLVRAALWAKSFRIGQLYPETAEAGEWRGMRMFLDRQVPAGDPRLQPVYRNFRENLTGICRMGRRAGAEVLLSTVAVNLAEQAPFASEGGAAADPTGLDCTSFRALAAQYPRNAGVHYRAGVACKDPAMLEQARDLDTLRFRADSTINAVIREVARDVDGVMLADAERHAEVSFYEHVHFTPEGNLKLAGFLADHLKRSLGDGRGGEATPVDLGLTNWDRRWMAADILAMTSQPPFAAPVVRAELNLPVDREQAIATCGPAALRLRCIELLRESGRLDDAIRDYRQLLSGTGDWASWRAGLGSILAEAGRHEEAQAEFVIALGRNPRLAAAHLGRGVSFARRERWTEAVTAFHEALRINPNYSDARNNLAAAHDALGRIAASQGKLPEAIEQLKETVRLKPDAAEAHYNLGALLSRAGRLPEAIAAYKEALRRKNDYAEAHNNLGTALARQGKLPAAAEHFRRALEIRPEYAEARRNLDLAMKR